MAMLEDPGHTVLEAHSGDEALKILAHGQSDENGKALFETWLSKTGLNHATTLIPQPFPHNQFPLGGSESTGK